MKNSKFCLIRWAAVLLVIAGGIFSFPSPSIERAESQRAVSPFTPTHVTLGDHQRPRKPEIERLLDLGDSKRFDLDIAALLNPEQERKTTNDHFGSNQQIASTTRPGKGGGKTNETGSLWNATSEW